MRHYWLGLISGLALVACAGATFPYRYYALDAENYAGYLRGPKPADDLLLASCMPTESDKAPCVTVMTSEFLKLKQDYLDTKNKLVRCQHGK